MSYKYYIGIDPDVEKPGVALWNKPEQKFEFIKSIEFWDLIEFFRHGYIDKKIWLTVGVREEDVKVIIDAGWLNHKVNFHPLQGNKIREKVAMNTGMNHEIGRLIERFCEKNGIAYELHKPSTTKIGSPAFSKITRWANPTNQDNRDAALLVFKK